MLKSHSLRTLNNDHERAFFFSDIIASMNYLHDFLDFLNLSSTAQSVCILSVVIVLGRGFGQLRFGPVQFGVGGVMFAGLLFGHLGLNLEPALGDFVRDFGLMLFVYTIGVEVGPAFFASLRKEGLRLNAYAFGEVLLGVVIAAILAKIFHISGPAIVGIFSGAVTNTPSFAAAQQLLSEMPNVSQEVLKLPALGYATAYPFGILSIILTLIFVRVVGRVDVSLEAEKHQSEHLKENPKLETLDIKIENADLDGFRLREILAFEEVVISRIVHEGKSFSALPKTKIHTGDVIRAVGTHEQLEALCYAAGARTVIDKSVESHLSLRRIFLTRTELAGKTISELNPSQHGVTTTRVRRGDLEFPGTGEVKLAYGDIVNAVGHEEDLKNFATALGDSPKTLSHPHLAPAFVCLAVGVMIGSFPLQIPGIPTALKIGLAGGVLIAALLLSYIGRIGPLVWYLPTSGSLMLREIGISLFLACVGLKSGDRFAETFTSGPGFLWVGCALAIGAIPLLVTAFLLHRRAKINFLTVCGVLAGCHTSPPALAYTNQLVSSSAPVMAYASVYPLVMILRVIAAELLLIFLM